MKYTRELELGIGILIVVGALAFALMGGATSPLGGTQGSAEGAGHAKSNLPSTASLVIDDSGFAPSSIALAAGEVTITVRNAATSTHGFALPDYSIDQIIPPEETRTFTFAARPGTYTFSDSIYENTGTLTVE
ncbi:MAG: cupredoxin domain-containing protein [Candidatus Aenigmatarchaeota archaeon]|nr:MAG: cupredoxin domain-containing protein [Candidatus Aenigmarchaeota archaeon]